MNVLFDIVHPADVNFFKRAIEIVRKDHDVLISVMDRGNLLALARSELGEVIVCGGHGKHITAKIVHNINRVQKLRKIIKLYQPDTVVGFSHYGALAAKGLSYSIVFHDDPEYRSQFALCKMADKLVLPAYLGIEGTHVKHYYGFKEWAYLKNYPITDYILGEFNLQKNNYIFIRDIAPISLNYKHAHTFDIPYVKAKAKAQHLDIVVSLEDESKQSMYDDCIVLDSPLSDFFSLVAHARTVISSGDTVVREAALLGVPAYYTGGRTMRINTPLIEQGLIHLGLESLDLHISAKKITAAKAKTFTKELDDVTNVIVKMINDD